MIRIMAMYGFTDDVFVVSLTSSSINFIADHLDPLDARTAKWKKYSSHCDDNLRKEYCFDVAADEASWIAKQLEPHADEDALGNMSEMWNTMYREEIRLQAEGK